jgi:hypothetical protein
MPTRYTRFGEYFLQGIAKLLSEGTAVDVPNVGRCTIVGQVEPRINSSNWFMQVDIGFPNSDSQMTIGLYTLGSCLLEDSENIELPQPTYEDPNDRRYPREHQDAWFRLLNALEDQLHKAGYVVGSSDDNDIYLITDYYPSDGISASLLKPVVVSEVLIELCQKLVKEHTGWNFWIRLGFDFTDKRYNGVSESILIREDRVVYDFNRERLYSEFGNDFALAAEAK